MIMKFDDLIRNKPAVDVSTVNCAFLLTKALFKPRPLGTTLEESELNLGRALAASCSEIDLVSMTQCADSGLPDGLPLPATRIGKN